MVVQGILAMALALPTGTLFGLGYGTGVRIGYEQIYPLLFPKTEERGDAGPVRDNIKQINKIYDLVGGKEASQMGIAQGILSAGELLNNPDFRVLEELESRLSGRTRSNLKKESQQETSFPSPADTQFDSTYQNIQYLGINDAVREYGLATQYKNGFTKSQNDTFLIPALKTRIAQLREASSTPTPKTPTELNQEQLKDRQTFQAPTRQRTPAEEQYNTYQLEKNRLQANVLNPPSAKQWKQAILSYNHNIRINPRTQAVYQKLIVTANAKIQSIIANEKKLYYNFLRLSMNNRTHLGIRGDASKSFNARIF